MSLEPPGDSLLEPRRGVQACPTSPSFRPLERWARLRAEGGTVPSLGKLEAPASGAGEHRLEGRRAAAGARRKGVPPAGIAARFLVLALAAGAVVAGWALARRAPRPRGEAGAPRHAL